MPLYPVVSDPPDPLQVNVLAVPVKPVAHETVHVLLHRLVPAVPQLEVMLDGRARAVHRMAAIEEREKGGGGGGSCGGGGVFVLCAN